MILDVREPAEVAICCISRIASAFRSASCRGVSASSTAAAEIVVHCKSGGRSARAVALLREKGFTRASNLTGGILSWINEIDPAMARY